MKFHWTTAVIQILSHLLLPLFCWLCLLYQQQPPQQRFGDKTGMPRTGTFTTLSSFRFPFIVSTIPFATHPAEKHQAMGLTMPATCSAMGRLSLVLISPSLDFTPGRIKSESFFHHLLWAYSMPGCVRNMTPGVHRQRGRAEKNKTAMQQCVRLQAPGEHWEDLGKPWHMGLTIYTLNSRTSQSYLEQAQLLRLFSWCTE